MKTLKFVILIMIATTSAMAGGGQDVLIDVHPADTPYLTWDVAAATDGTLFASCHGDSAKTILNIYRSTNGGTTWKLWDQLESVFTEGRVYDASLATTSGNPGKLLVAWVDQRLSSAGSWVRISRASVDDEVPSWSRSDPWFIFNLEVEEPRIETIAAAGFQDRVCLGWINQDDLYYSNSEDSGVTWSTPLNVMDNPPSASISGFEIAADNNGVTHMAWINHDYPANTGRVNYRRAQWGGELIGNWTPTQVLRSSTAGDGVYKVALAANHSFGGTGVVVVAGGSALNDPPTSIYESDDQGLTWEAPTHLDFLSAPVAVWGASGPVIAMETFGTEEWGTAYTLLTRDGTDWSVEVLTEKNTDGNRIGQVGLALDPTRDDAPMIAFLQEIYRDDDYGFWFNATWRDAPGYGVPDPLVLHRPVDSQVTKPVLAGNMDDDATLELIVAEEDGPDSMTLRFIDPDDGGVIYSFYGMAPSSDMALIDNDGDGELEVFFVRTFDGRVGGRNGNGSSVTGYPEEIGLGLGPFWISGGHVLSSEVENVVVAAERSVYILDDTGTEPAPFPWTAPAAAGDINGRVAIGDVDNDGDLDLVIPLTDRVVVLDRDAQVISFFGEGEAAAGSPSLTDFDLDGDLEIVIPRADGTIHLVHHDGTSVAPQWPYDTGAAGMPSQVALADIARDERRDLIFMDASHTVHVVTRAGHVDLLWEMDVDPASPVNEPVVAKVGTGEPAVIVGGADGVMRVHTLEGPQEGWPRPLGEPILTAATVADVDADGIVELIFPTEKNTWVLDMGVAEPDSLKLWTMSGADPSRTGTVYGGPIELSATPEMPAGFMALHGAAPNPFNPVTSIRFSLSEEAPAVSLRVYDVAGRVVKTLHLGALQAGDHQVVWRGDDESGRTMASGVYFCRLETGGLVLSRPMTLVR